MSEVRVLPLPKVTGVYEHEFSKYPDRIRVPMSDGKVVTYALRSHTPQTVTCRINGQLHTVATQ